MATTNDFKFFPPGGLFICVSKIDFFKSLYLYLRPTAANMVPMIPPTKAEATYDTIINVFAISRWFELIRDVSAGKNN